MMKWMHQCRGVSSYWHHLSDVCFDGCVVVSAAVATTLLNPRHGARKTLQRTSKIRAAKVLDVVASPPGCATKASDAVSAHTQVKMEDALHLGNFLSLSVQVFGFVYLGTYGKRLENQWFPSK